MIISLLLKKSVYFKKEHPIKDRFMGVKLDCEFIPVNILI